MQRKDDDDLNLGWYFKKDGQAIETSTVEQKTVYDNLGGKMIKKSVSLGIMIWPVSSPDIRKWTHASFWTISSFSARKANQVICKTPVLASKHYFRLKVTL